MAPFDLHMYAVERAFEALKSGQSQDMILMPVIVNVQGKLARTHAICIEHVDDDGLNFTPVFIAPSDTLTAFVSFFEVKKANERRLAEIQAADALQAVEA